MPVCTFCKRQCAPGTMACPRCGTKVPPEVKAKPAASPPKAPAKAPPRKVATRRAAAEPSFVPPTMSTRERSRINRASIVKGVGGLGLLVTLALIGWRFWRAYERSSGGSKERVLCDQSIEVKPNDMFCGTVDVQEGGSGSYTFTVSADDGPVIVGVEKVRETDGGPLAALGRVMTGGRPVAQGSKDTLTGTLTSGKYFWGVVNKDPQKAVSAHIKFVVR